MAVNGFTQKPGNLAETHGFCMCLLSNLSVLCHKEFVMGQWIWLELLMVCDGLNCWFMVVCTITKMAIDQSPVDSL